MNYQKKKNMSFSNIIFEGRRHWMSLSPRAVRGETSSGRRSGSSEWPASPSSPKAGSAPAVPGSSWPDGE